jgi:valyl-tRNA synthetase
MSKTRGNIIEPIELIDQYGADAVRFTLSSMAVPGTDIPFSSDRMKGYSAFANKVWNAARFVLMNLRQEDAAVDPEEIDAILNDRGRDIPPEDRWILHRLNLVSAEISEALSKYRFHEASALIYQFIWHELCDWYIELVKPILTDSSDAAGERAFRSRILIHVLDYALRLLHPFMPFLTEEIWQKIPHKGDSIMIQEFPVPRDVRANAEAARKMQDLMDLIGGIRSLRAEMNVDPKRLLDAVIVIPSEGDGSLVESNLEKVRTLARLGNVRFSEALSADMLRGVCRIGEFGLDVHGAIDVAAETERLRKETDRIQAEMEKLEKKLNSDDFLSRAPEEVVADNRARYEELKERYLKIQSNLKNLPVQ